MSENNQKISVPIAIIIAGAIIAVAIFLSNTSGTTVSPNNAKNSETVDPNTYGGIEIKPITTGDKIRGNPNAPITIVEFSDLECPFCKTIHKTLQAVIDKYGKEGTVSWVYKHFPLTQLHSKAIKEAEAVECAGKLGGNDIAWKYIDKVIEITPSNNGLDLAKLPEIATGLGLNEQKFNSCLDSGETSAQVQTEYEEALAAGGSGTPYSVFLVKKPLSDEQIATIREIGVGLPPDIMGVSSDKMKIFMSGALPYSIIEKIILAIE